MVATRLRSEERIFQGFKAWLEQPVSSLPLALFRMAFGLLMLVSTVRFILRGWIHEFYLAPQVHFSYLGFGWVKPLPELGLYAVFALLLLSSLFIIFGLFYRLSMLSFFLLFSYVELLDKTYYLNHYYFVSLLSFLLLFLPLNRTLALDVRLGLAQRSSFVPAWTLYAIRLQLALVYFFAGIAKLNPDWLLQAQPLSIWLRANTDLPVIGFLFDYTWVAHAMSWAGMVYDLSIPFFLLFKKTRPFAYLVVIAFHVLTALLFPIGMFPWIMMVSTLIFFSLEDVKRAARAFGKRLTLPSRQALRKPLKNPVLFFLSLFFLFQVGMSLRHHLYPGNVLWTEEGYRFSWRVMLAEKTGRALFTVRDMETSQTWTVFPSHYLTPQQEKQMAFQSDMVLQFAHFLRDEFETQGHEDISVYADVWVSLNGRPSQRFIDKKVNLASQPYGLAPRSWLSQLR